MLINGTEIDLANLEKPLLLINEDEENKNVKKWV